jgi:6-pyruvoyltetrahydropterin/6-carboxytetrahydropterin synthase
MFELKVESTFSAAHHLLNYDGECENQHGHNWKIEAFFRGEKLNESNLLIDFKILKKNLNKILDLLDHTDINELEYFKNNSPSSEAIAKFIYEKLKADIPELFKISVWETAHACASYFE